MERKLSSLTGLVIEWFHSKMFHSKMFHLFCFNFFCFTCFACHELEHSNKALIDSSSKGTCGAVNLWCTYYRGYPAHRNHDL